MNATWGGKTVSWWPTTVVTGVSSIEATGTASVYKTIKFNSDTILGKTYVTGINEYSSTKATCLTGIKITLKTKRYNIIRELASVDGTI